MKQKIFPFVPEKSHLTYLTNYWKVWERLLKISLLLKQHSNVVAMVYEFSALQVNVKITKILNCIHGSSQVHCPQHQILKMYTLWTRLQTIFFLPSKKIRPQKYISWARAPLRKRSVLVDLLHKQSIQLILLLLPLCLRILSEKLSLAWDETMNG